jgi:hypothetical protein
MSLPYAIFANTSTGEKIANLHFFLGEMPRDPFGGESRDLEPFAQV